MNTVFAIKKKKYVFLLKVFQKARKLLQILILQQKISAQEEYPCHSNHDNSINDNDDDESAG